jgi:hypothetical protein
MVRSVAGRSLKDKHSWLLDQPGLTHQVKPLNLAGL